SEKYPSPPAAPRPNGAALADKAVQEKLKQAWKKGHDLHAQVPSPAVHSPHLWRSYLDTLLRYESVLRSGSAEKEAKRLLDKLEQLEKDLKEAPRLPGSLDGVVAVALPMHAALGRAAPWNNDQLKEWGDALWDPAGQKKSRPEVWKELHE